VPKWCKFIIAILLFPVCFGAGQALWQAVTASGEASTVWMAMFAGATCWLVIFWLLPKPMWIYVFGHELTHVLWTWLFGGKVKKFKATAKGGHVIVTKMNFLISLAPYFFPLYAAIVVIIFVIGHLIWNWKPYAPLFHLMLGGAYAFHITLTWQALQTEQTDITVHGYLFSSVIIFLGNITVLLMAIPLLAGQIGLVRVFEWWWRDTVGVITWLARLHS